MRVKGGKCSFCGKESSAVWHGEDVVRVCGACAVEAVPALMADALWSRSGNGAVANYDRQLEAATRAFWRAVACRLATGFRPDGSLRDDGEGPS